MSPGSGARPHALSPRRLAGRLAWLALLCSTLPLLVLGGIATLAARESALSEAQVQGRELARQGARQVHAILDGYRRSLGILANALASTPTFEPRHLRRVVRDLQLGGREFAALDLLGVDGTPIVSSRLDEATVPSVPGALLERARKGPAYDRPYVGEALEAEVRLAQPVRFEGKLRAFLVATVRLSETWAAVTEIRVGARGRARLLGEGGIELGHGDPREQAALLARSSNRGAAPGPAAPDLVVVAEPIPDLGWTVSIERPASEAFALARKLTWTVAALVVVVAALAGGLAVELARRTTAPLGTLVDHARGLAEHLSTGRPPPPVELEGPEDLRELAEAVDAMSAQLARVLAEARDTERLAIVARVGAGLAHDLRTPLVAVQGLGQMLVNDEGASKLARQVVPQIDRELSRVGRFIERMEALAKGFRGDRPPKVPLDLGGLASTAAERFRSAALLPEGVELLVTVPPVPMRVLGHPDDAERLVENLLQNAGQAMDGRTGRVWLTLQRSGSEAVLAVRDEGRGIEAERRSRLFSEFKSTRRGGFGIGLAMVRMCAEEMGGKLEVDSEVGVGTTFRLRVPLVPDGEPHRR